MEETAKQTQNKSIQRESLGAGQPIAVFLSTTGGSRLPNKEGNAQ